MDPTAADLDAVLAACNRLRQRRHRYLVEVTANRSHRILLLSSSVSRCVPLIDLTLAMRWSVRTSIVKYSYMGIEFPHGTGADDSRCVQRRGRAAAATDPGRARRRGARRERTRGPAGAGSATGVQAPARAPRGGSR